MKRVVKAVARTVIPANSMKEINVSFKKPPAGSYLFMPDTAKTVSACAHIVDSECHAVWIQNDSPRDITLGKKTKLGYLTDLLADGSEPCPKAYYRLAFAGEVEPAEDGWSLSRPPEASNGNDNDRARSPRSPLLSAPTPGIRATPTDAGKEQLGPFGTHIFGRSDDEAKQISDAIAEFPGLFSNEDSGRIATIPEEEWMRIPLTSDWERSDAKLAHKVYPLGPQERALVDEQFDKLHKVNKMSWIPPGSPTPFGFPVFVVWKDVNGKRKGRVVVDIRGLNKVTVPDAYPMPLQSDVTAAVAGCHYITVTDGLSFFYQWPVAKEDRHKLAVVSHRGQEQFNVAPMGFRNSPPYVQRQGNRILRKHASYATVSYTHLTLPTN